MALTSFEAVSVALFGGAGERQRNAPALSYAVRLADGESIEITTGEKFDDLKGQFVVSLDTEEAPPVREDATGLIAYHEAHGGDDYSFPASYTIQIWVPRATFDELLSAARFGRMPSKMTIETKGMDYDWQPDGSGKKWDNKKSRYLKIDSFGFELPLYHPAVGNFPRPLSEEGMPTTRTQFDELSLRIDRLAEATQGGLKRLLWSVIIVAVVFLLFRWRG
jgi:hypothetical protein